MAALSLLRYACFSMLLVVSAAPPSFAGQVDSSKIDEQIQNRETGLAYRLKFNLAEAESYKKDIAAAPDKGFLYAGYAGDLYTVAMLGEEQNRAALLGEAAQAVITAAQKADPGKSDSGWRISPDHVLLLLLTAPGEPEPEFSRRMALAERLYASMDKSWGVVGDKTTALWLDMLRQTMLLLPENQAARLKPVALAAAKDNHVDPGEKKDDLYRKREAYWAVALADLSLAFKGPQRVELAAMAREKIAAATGDVPPDEDQTLARINIAQVMLLLGEYRDAPGVSASNAVQARKPQEKKTPSPALKSGADRRKALLGESAEHLAAAYWGNNMHVDMPDHLIRLEGAYKELAAKYPEDGLLLAQYAVASLAALWADQDGANTWMVPPVRRGNPRPIMDHALALAPNDPLALLLAAAFEQSAAREYDASTGVDFLTKAACLGPEIPATWDVWDQAFGELKPDKIQEMVFTPLGEAAKTCPAFADYAQARTIVAAANHKASGQSGPFMKKFLQLSLDQQLDVIFRIRNKDYAPLVASGLLTPEDINRKMSISEEETLGAMAALPILEGALKRSPPPAAASHIRALLAKVAASAWDDFDSEQKPPQTGRLEQAYREYRQSLADFKPWETRRWWTAPWIRAFSGVMGAMFYSDLVSATTEDLLRYRQELMSARREKVFTDACFRTWEGTIDSGPDPDKRLVKRQRLVEAVISIAGDEPLPEEAVGWLQGLIFFGSREASQNLLAALKARHDELMRKKPAWAERFFDAFMLRVSGKLVSFAFGKDADRWQEYVDLGRYFAAGDKDGLAAWKAELVALQKYMDQPQDKLRAAIADLEK